jgi:hypothetical protein
MFCGNCGCKNDDGAGFCKECGSKLNGNNNVNDFNFDQQPFTNPNINVDSDNSNGNLGSNNNRQSVPIKLIAGICAIVMAITAAVIIFMNMQPTIDMDKYVEVTFYGYNGYGSATAEINWDKILEDYSSKIKYTSEGRKIEDELGIDPVHYMQSTISLYLDNYEHLSNGDEVQYVWNVDKEALSKALKCNVKYTDKTVQVSNLEEIGKFDPFEGVTVNFSGIEPDGEAWMDYSGELLSREDFELDVPDGGLKNGDTVTVTLRNSDIDSYARSLGKIPSSTQKEYTVKGLDKYISKLSDVNESLLNDAKNNAEEIIRNEISGWSRDVKLDSIDYLGYYVQSMDDFDDKNMLGVVYKLHSTISSDEEDAGVNQYYDVRFRNVVINGSGDYEIDWDNYYTPSDSFEIMVDYSYGKYSFTYTGYSTLDGLKNERNNQDYDVEMNVEDKDNSAYEQDEENPEQDSEQVEEEVKQEKKGSKKKSDKKNDFLWKDSSKIKLTDSNVEKIVKKASKGDVSKKLVGRSYARMIINEMYARKGSKFNDPKLMKYFNTKSWYKKIKKKISKEKVKFSKLEQDNINILDDYDKNFLQAD